MFRNVLVPVDGSERSLAAVECAAKATAPDGRITLLEVVDTVSEVTRIGSAAALPEITESVLEGARQEAAAHLEQARAHLTPLTSVDARTEILAGRPGDTIVATAQDDGYDLVVMGTHGRSGITRTVMGSVAEHIVRHLRGVPILLINPSE